MIYEVFGQVPVQKVDTSFVVCFFARHVVGTDLVVDRTTGATYSGGDVITDADIADVWADLLNDSEGFVTEDKVVITGWWITVEGFVDFAVGRIDTNF